MPLQLKEVFKPVQVHKAFYTGGNLEWSLDSLHVYCHCDATVQILNVNDGKVTSFLGDNEPQEDAAADRIQTFTLDYKNNLVISAHKSGLLKVWNLQTNKVAKHWKSVHKGPVMKLALSIDSTILATGGSDSSIRLWDLQNNTCLYKLTGIKGVVTALTFFKSKETTFLFGAADDTVINVWNVDSGKLIMKLSGHYSTVTGIVISHDGNHIVSCGRDKVLILWNFLTGKQIHVIPLYESIEGLVLLPNKFNLPENDKKITGGIFVATGGEKGVIRIWDVSKVTELYVQQNSIIDCAKGDSGLAITNLIFNEATSNFLVSSSEHNIFIHNLETFSCLKQLVGFSDEVLDVIIVGPQNSHVIVANNSPRMNMYKLSNMNCRLLKGHSDLVVALASTPSNPCLFASSSKDNSFRIWLLENEIAYCVASGMLHNNSVGAVAISQLKTNFVLSGSQDTVLKKWKLPSSIDHNQTITLQMKAAQIAHEKDINCISVSPNDKLVATASMDKTAKVWESKNLTLLGTLRGHKRGVWTVSFSPSDQVLLTTSADTTLKIWSISDLSCLKTFEGHDSSVLKGEFLSNGLQIISSGGDGLLKLWNVKTSECTASFDKHNGKIWALAVMKGEETIITGGDDSQLVIWQDVTEEVRLAKAKEFQEKACKEQQLANCLQADDLLNALRLALSLDRPATVLKVFQDVINRGEIGLEETVKQLDEKEKYLLLSCASHWNANSKFCYPAQIVISLLIDEIALGELNPSKEILESVSAYTERHFKRLTQLLQDLRFLEYTKVVMKPHCIPVEE
ncbi:transducin beta-like protein 3 [Rhodnius prolixus]|uniref:transducin beta-like protein 3 n=1 Tax=Rhodnius prolixus TaxID=13249 RepID=UPI003D189190